MVLTEMAGAEDTIYLCNFRVSVDGDWLCLKELAEGRGGASGGGSGASRPTSPGSPSAGPDGMMGSAHYALPPNLFTPYVPIAVERDPVSIERSNLVNICKLVVKELIESSLKSGRQLDSDSVPLQHFFIVLEHVLRHGLKPKRGLLGPKKELWDLFQLVERWSVEAQDITASVRDLPTVNTALGRARAWLRLALMQKKLSDYFRLLLERRDDLLLDFYEPGSLMLADEAVVIMGLLVGLNVVDCNLCVKEEDLDSQMGVIDFSLYLRRGPACSPGGGMGDGPPHPSHATDLPSDQDNLTTVLDQKNYIEELNRHLNATVSNLQARVESLTTTNALMKEDLSIARTSLASMQDENDSLRQERGLPTQAMQNTADREAKRAARISVIGCEEELQDLKRHLEEEGSHRKQVERELELQVQMKAESEMAAKLLEKDIHEKQDTIVSLRRQLEDIKIINLEMYQKLQECESSLRQKTELIGQLEEKTAQMADTIRKLETQYVSSDKVAGLTSSSGLGEVVVAVGSGSGCCPPIASSVDLVGDSVVVQGGVAKRIDRDNRALSCEEGTALVVSKTSSEGMMTRAMSCADPIYDVDLLSGLSDKDHPDVNLSNADDVEVDDASDMGRNLLCSVPSDLVRDVEGHYSKIEKALAKSTSDKDCVEPLSNEAKVSLVHCVEKDCDVVPSCDSKPIEENANDDCTPAESEPDERNVSSLGDVTSPDGSATVQSGDTDDKEAK